VALTQVLGHPADTDLVSRNRDRSIVDTSALRVREATVTAGVWLTYVVGGLGEVYVALTWQRANRPALAALFAMAVLAGIVVSLLPRERIVRSRFREVFFLSWTFLDFALIVLGTLADGGTGSPLVLVFFIPVVFSSMSYPLGSVALVGGISVLSYLTLAVTIGGSSWSYQAAFAVVLACTGVMSAWQAQSHNRQREALAEVSRADPLTGCLNRRGFEERAIAEILAATRQRRQGAVMVIDIDHFKPVNDRHGHAAGDALLCWLVQTLNLLVRPSDAVGRIGGDEFAVLFAEIEPADALLSAARVARALSERAPSSVGVATFPMDGTEFEQLMRRADMRLYASRRGRYDPDTTAVIESPGRVAAPPPAPTRRAPPSLDPVRTR
jgi:diguanylate cyclase (GGDEF)-like protein